MTPFKAECFKRVQKVVAGSVYVSSNGLLMSGRRDRDSHSDGGVARRL